jgi:ribosomal protein S18 acetylase RimI-like enzyme
MLSSWAALETVADGSWVARFSRGHTKRANSLTILDVADGRDEQRRLDTVAAAYRHRQLPPTLRLTPLTPPAVGAAVLARGGVPFEKGVALGRMLQPAGIQSPGPDIQLLRPTDPAWIEAQGRFHGFDVPTVATLTEMVRLISVPSAALLLKDDAGNAVGAALVLLVGDLAMILKVIVGLEARGRGYGRKLVDAALGWASGQGANEVFLHALASNTPAVSLYRSLGFAERYSFSHAVFG